MVTLKKILSTPRYSGLKLLTSPETLNDQIIQSAEITETPDVQNFIPKNVLILTTALFFKDQQSKLISFIDSLKDADVVGLGIKINRFLGDLDPQVIDYANSIGFPIFTIPDQYTLGSLLHQIMNLVLDNQKEEMDFALDMQKSFSDLLLQDASNKRLVDELSKTISTPVILVSPFKTVKASSNYFNHKEALAKEYVRILSEKQAELGRMEGTFIIENTKAQTVQLSVVKIQSHAYYFDYLIIFNASQISYPFSIFALEQAAIIFSYSLFKNTKLKEAQYAEEAHFFNQLIENHFDQAKIDDHWNEMAKHYGYNHSDFYQVIHITSEKMLTKATNDKLTFEQLFLTYTWIRENLHNYFEQAVVIWHAESKEIILLLQNEDEKLNHKLLMIRETLYAMLQTKLIFNVGSSYNDWKKIKTSYTQSQIVHSDRSKHNNFETILFYQENGLHELFNNLNQNQIIYFCEYTLKDLAFPTDPSDIELRNTLKTYLDNQCEITQTANELFIHRNTVKYRIQKCEDLLGTEIKSPQNSLNLRLALDLSEKD